AWARGGCAGLGGRWSGLRRCRLESRLAPAEWQAYVHAESAAAHRRHLERAAHLLDALANAAQAIAEADVIGARAVVTRVDVEGVISRGHRHPQVAGAGMSHRVGHALLRAAPAGPR